MSFDFSASELELVIDCCDWKTGKLRNLPTRVTMEEMKDEIACDLRPLLSPYGIAADTPEVILPLERIVSLCRGDREVERVEVGDADEMGRFARYASQTGEIDMSEAGIEVPVYILDVAQVRFFQGEIEAKFLNDVLSFANIAARQNRSPVHKLAVPFTE
jgi:hypothetical protein